MLIIITSDAIRSTSKGKRVQECSEKDAEDRILMRAHENLIKRNRHANQCSNVSWCLQGTVFYRRLCSDRLTRIKFLWAHRCNSDCSDRLNSWHMCEWMAGGERRTRFLCEVYCGAFDAYAFTLNGARIINSVNWHKICPLCYKFSISVACASIVSIMSRQFSIAAWMAMTHEEKWRGKVSIFG